MMPIEGSLIVRDSDSREVILEETMLDGEMNVIGYYLNNAQISLYFAQQGQLNLYSNDGVSFILNELDWNEDSINSDDI